jgi:hypothetical protein
MSSREIEEAFDDALIQVERARTAGMLTLSGKPAEGNLDRLADELRREREPAVRRGAADREWFQRTLKWVVEWAPEEDLTLIAALGRIARAPAAGLS